MKKIVSVVMLVALMAVSILTVVKTASAEDVVKIIGTISKIEMAADGKSAVATLKDNKTSKDIPIFINDDLTLDKFKDHRIVEGDEIRCKFENVDGKNHSKLFKKTAGC